MFPESIPVFTADDILPNPTEFEAGKLKSAIGWLKHLFLYYTCEDNSDCIQIRPEDRKSYEKAVDILRKECKIRGSLFEWEETTSRKSQAAALNKMGRKLGYVKIIDI